MNFLKKLSVQNFRCIRQETVLDLSQGTYLVGANNSGKTAFLAALRCFFDSSIYRPGDLNKTEFTSKKAGFNTSEISIEFDLTVVEGKVRKKRMLELYGDSLKIKKLFTYREASDTINIDYEVGSGKVQFFDKLDKDVQDILKAVSVSYIHPQEGGDLLAKAQDKFKQRLFHNWGRHASVSDQLKDLQDKWDDLRSTANSYLSAALTESLRKFWPGSSTVIDLPEKIEEIVAISDIAFRSAQNLPEVTLTSQGTGAQSIVLYQTHYILDSDRSLHRGFYVPIWLLEEPESFLHTDIAVKLGNLLASNQWLGNIQIITSTHSPVILACSRQSEDNTSWVALSNHEVKKQIAVKDVIDDDIRYLGELMGDSNFDAYFTASQANQLVFIEDKRPLTKEKFEEAGIPVTRAFDGVSEAKKYLDVFRTVEGFAAKNAVVILDNDKGIKDFNVMISNGTKVRELSGFELHKVGKNAFILLLPPSSSVEFLFDEFDDTLEECVRDVFTEEYALRGNVPLELTRAASAARSRVANVRSMDDAKDILGNQQDIKDVFWKRVAERDLKMSDHSAEVITALIELTN